MKFVHTQDFSHLVFGVLLMSWCLEAIKKPDYDSYWWVNSMGEFKGDFNAQFNSNCNWNAISIGSWFNHFYLGVYFIMLSHFCCCFFSPKSIFLFLLFDQALVTWFNTQFNASCNCKHFWFMQLFAIQRLNSLQINIKITG